MREFFLTTTSEEIFKKSAGFFGEFNAIVLLELYRDIQYIRAHTEELHSERLREPDRFDVQAVQGV